MALQTEGIVLSNRNIGSTYFLLDIDCQPIARLATPGQFVMLTVPNGDRPLLRRPFSIYRCTPAHPSKMEKRGQISILYKQVGTGTLKMTGLRKNQTVGLIGPLVLASPACGKGRERRLLEWPVAKSRPESPLL